MGRRSVFYLPLGWYTGIPGMLYIVRRVGRRISIAYIIVEKYKKLKDQSTRASYKLRTGDY